MYGERRGIHVIQHNTNEPKTREKPGYMPSGLAFSEDVNHRNNSKDSNQATANNMGMDRGRMQKEPDRTTSLPTRQQPKPTTRLLLLYLHSDWAMKTPMIVTLTQPIIIPILCRTSS